MGCSCCLEGGPARSPALEQCVSQQMTVTRKRMIGVTCVCSVCASCCRRTSLRVRHLLPSFKPAGKGQSKGGRSSETGEGSHGGHHPHQHSHGHGSHASSGGGAGRRSMDGSLLTHTPGAYQPPSRRSLEFQRPAHQQQHAASDLSPASSGGGSEQGAPGAAAATASAAAAAATAGLPMHLAPIRTQPNSSGGGSKAGSSAGGVAAAVGRLPGSPSAGGASSPRCSGSPIKLGSPMKAHLSTGLGGNIGSPRSVKSPAPPEVASLIDGILAAPTGGTSHTPTNDGHRNSSSGRWSSGSGLGIEVDRTTPHQGTPVSSPAAAVAAALAGVMTPPQSGTPRVSTSSTPGRESLPGGLRTPTRMSAAGAAAAAAAAAASGGGSSGGGSLSPMAPHLAAQAAAAAALVSSPKASSAANWRSGANTPASSMPGTPLSSTLSISAGAAVGAELDAWSPPAGGAGAFSVGSPSLSGGGAGKPAPWIPASRLAHHQRVAAAGSSDGGGSASAGDSWRSGGGSRPPRGSMPSSGGGSSGGGTRQRRRSWHATEAEEAVVAAGSHAAANAAAAVADGSTSDSSSSVRKAGSHRSSRLGQAGDYHATIEAIREASCELDSGMVGRAIAALSGGGRRRGSSTGGGGAEGVVSPEGGDAAEGDSEAAGKRRRARHRRSRSSGSRRQSMDDARPHAFSPEVPASGGVGAVGLSSHGAVRHGPLAADDAHHRHHQRDKHSSSGGGSEHHNSHGGARGSSAGGHSHGGDSTGKKKEKKDYAAWAAATPEFRAAATAAKHSSGGGSGGPVLAALSTSPARSPMMSPMRGAGGAFSQQAPGSPLPVHSHHLEHTARGPDGSRGFAMGRGRPLTPAAP